MDSSIIALIISMITIVLFISNKLPMSVVAMFGSLAMGILIPEMQLSAVYSGFSSPGWPMVVGMLVVSDALFETGIAERIGIKIGNSFLAKNERRFIITVAIIVTIMSAFMSNNGTVAIWMPIIAAVAAGSNGRIRSKMVIFVAGTAAVIGGGSTLIGSTSQLAANGILQGYEGFEAGMGIFDMSRIMIPAAIIQVIYWATIGYSILKWALKPESPDFDKNNVYATTAATSEDLSEDRFSDVPKWKGNVALFTMILSIVLFILSGFAPFNKYLNIGIIGMLGATIILGTGTVPVKDTFSRLPWDVLITIGAISGLGTGLDASGGGELIANAVLTFFGGANATIPVLTVIIAVLTSVLTNFMQNNATAAMIAPITISIAMSLDISPLPWVILVAACSNLAIATSYGTAVNMQILPAGYKFMDFVKIGGPLLILMIITVTVTSSLFLF
ncbi:SLC13 family permease [Clostridium sp. UBA6640]|uniref:SLC13 family permease n=1 Tax=Clostridium sp. UBA6640 TaxID=1946370 RepID=UPI0025C70A26|nr:SLC13 family permease [Clostridium sp. UBA6640]